MQIILFLLLVLAVLLIFVSKKDSLAKTTKIYIIISLVLVLVAGWLFTLYNQNTAKNGREILNAYEQGKTITCDNYKVDINSFIFISGTLSFVAKEDNKEYKGVVIDISTCKK
jgi:formate hydrogenlyase subunit 3/multisubunit Na+/H+ antiporter MnhD subunit